LRDPSRIDWQAHSRLPDASSARCAARAHTRMIELPCRFRKAPLGSDDRLARTEIAHGGYVLVCAAMSSPALTLTVSA
jgi:hypothetical protein